MYSAGPFSATHMLDIERFQTVFKSLARGTVNVMKSIENHYILLEASLANRVAQNGVEWTRSARNSTTAGFAAKPDAKDKLERVTEPMGAGTSTELSLEDLAEVRTIKMYAL